MDYVRFSDLIGFATMIIALVALFITIRDDDDKRK